MDGITIGKPVLPDDVRGIQEVFYRSWLVTYPNETVGITRDDVEAYFKDMFTPDVLQKRSDGLASLPANELFLVAKDGKRVVGVCRLIRRDDCGQLQAIYILPEYQRRGIGGVFWDRALDFFDPMKKVIVHVATYNMQAISFYEKVGFEDTGKRFSEERHRMPVSGALIPEMEMELKR